VSFTAVAPAWEPNHYGHYGRPQLVAVSA
jgi:hypothetical protein